jgi:rubrerythrin
LGAKDVDNLLMDILTKGYQEEVVSLLKYRRLAKSVERLYGSQALNVILRDEERHAKLLLGLAQYMDIDIAKIGENALFEELKTMADFEMSIVNKYEEVLGSELIADEQVLNVLKTMAMDSRRHNRILTLLLDQLAEKIADDHEH